MIYKYITQLLREDFSLRNHLESQAMDHRQLGLAMVAKITPTKISYLSDKARINLSWVDLNRMINSKRTD